MIISCYVYIKRGEYYIYLFAVSVVISDEAKDGLCIEIIVAYVQSIIRVSFLIVQFNLWVYKWKD